MRVRLLSAEVWFQRRIIQSYTCKLIMNHISRTCEVTDEQAAERQTSLIKVCDQAGSDFWNIFCDRIRNVEINISIWEKVYGAREH